MEANVKSKYSARSLVVRCIIIVIGVALAGFGSGCVIAANLGADPVTAFVNSMGRLTGLGAGTAMNLFNLFFFILILFMNRKMINIGMIIYTLLLGVFFGFFVEQMGNLLGDMQTSNEAMALVVRALLLVLGVLCVAVGLGMYQSADLGAGPSDAFNQTVSAKTKLALRWERIIFDAIMVVGALIMSAIASSGSDFKSDIFVGTIIGMVAVGPIMAPVIFHGAKIVNKLCGMDPGAGLGGGDGADVPESEVGGTPEIIESAENKENN